VSSELAGRRDSVGERRQRQGGCQLPHMRVYAGRKEDFEDFRERFEIRYGEEDRKIAVAMLREVLVGKALDEFRNIPERVKMESVHACLDYLGKRLSEEVNPFYEIEVQNKLREQRVGGRSVSAVCDMMDRWVDRLYKDEEEKRSVKIRQLLYLYKTSPEYLRMLEIFERDGSYREMREHLIRMEFVQKQSRDWNREKNRDRNREWKREANAQGYVPKANRVEMGGKGEKVNDESLFMNRIDPVSGMIGGKEMVAIMDTGAEVSLISMERVREMEVQIERCKTDNVKSASGDTIDIVGKCILSVKLSIGKEAETGFYVSKNPLGVEDQVILGGAALHAMGIGLVELPRDDWLREKENGEKAIVVKEVRIGPGEMGSVMVTTGRDESDGVRVLWSEREEVVDGIMSIEREVKNVSIPVINLSEEEITIRKNEVVGEWIEMGGKLVEEDRGGVVNKVDVSWNHDRSKEKDGDRAGWVEIKEVLEKNREGVLPEELEEVLKEPSKVFARERDQNEKREREEKEKKEKILEEWKKEQDKDEWARVMVEMIEKGGSSEGDEYTDCTVREGLLNIIGEDHEERLYVPEGVRKKLVMDVHENPLVGHMGAKRLVE
ncbi:hypothetical protein PMAYCL1PPCAC_18500, partial [Pristionchus mayeri]